MKKTIIENYLLYLEGEMALHEFIQPIANFAGKYAGQAMNAITRAGQTGVGKRVIGGANQIRTGAAQVAANMQKSRMVQAAANKVTALRNTAAAQAAKQRVDAVTSGAAKRIGQIKNSGMVNKVTTSQPVQAAKNMATGMAKDTALGYAERKMTEKPTQNNQ